MLILLESISADQNRHDLPERLLALTDRILVVPNDKGKYQASKRNRLILMPKAEVTLPDGTRVTISGSETQVAEIINLISPSSGKGRGSGRKSHATPTRSGPSAHIQSLVGEGYFKKKRSIGNIQTALEERGYIYSTPSLAPTLIRLVRKLGPLRRFKEVDGYKYVNR